MATPARKLRVVPVEPSVVDLYAAWRAEIRARDWGRVMIAADRREPIYLPDRPKRLWRG